MVARELKYLCSLTLHNSLKFSILLVTCTKEEGYLNEESLLQQTWIPSFIINHSYASGTLFS